MDRAGFAKLLEAYQFSGKRPLTDEVIAIMTELPGILQRRPSAERIETRMTEFMGTYPDRGAEVIAEDCAFEDIARGEKLPGKEA